MHGEDIISKAFFLRIKIRSSSSYYRRTVINAPRGGAVASGDLGDAWLQP
jgi:hypothetical protein